MKEGTRPLATALAPVLDTYSGAAVAVVGCHASGIQRESCEIDVIVVTNETRPPATVRYGETYFDLSFLSEKEAMKPSDSEVAVALAGSRPVRDSALILSTSLASNQAVVGASARKASLLRLTSCLKALSRVEECLAGGRVRAANYWLTAASYDFAFSWLYGSEAAPSPSHLLRQLRERSKGSPQSFESFAAGAGLERSSRRTCQARLDAVAVLHDVIGARGVGEGGPAGSIAGTELEVVRGKAEELASKSEHAESYSFLGREVVSRLRTLAAASESGKMSADGMKALEEILPDQGQGLLSDRVVRDLGLERTAPEVKAALGALRPRVAKLARKA